ncbi:MAG: hypothetical protein Q4G06_00315 [Clostridia bacterium]|nr:hypothetical protein [Clostridia bacterium]
MRFSASQLSLRERSFQKFSSAWPSRKTNSTRFPGCISIFLTRLNLTKSQTMEALARLWYDSSNWQWHASQNYDGSRHRLLNLHAVWQKGTIECRASIP